MGLDNPKGKKPKQTHEPNQTNKKTTTTLIKMWKQFYLL